MVWVEAAGLARDGWPYIGVCPFAPRCDEAERQERQNRHGPPPTSTGQKIADTAEDKRGHPEPEDAWLFVHDLEKREGKERSHSDKAYSSLTPIVLSRYMVSTAPLQPSRAV